MPVWSTPDCRKEKMSTRSNIVIELPDKKVKSIYVHCDGYPYGIGKILMDNYNSYEKAIKLFDYGDASYLSDTLNECSFYHRDWGRKLDKARTHRDEWLYMRNMGGDCFIEYIYIFKNDEWHVCELKRMDTENGYEDSVWYHSKFELLSENKDYIKYKDKHEKHAEVNMISGLQKILESATKGTGASFTVQSMTEGAPKKN